MLGAVDRILNQDCLVQRRRRRQPEDKPLPREMYVVIIGTTGECLFYQKGAAFG